MRSGPHQFLWDMGFLAVGAALVVGGWAIQRGATFNDEATSSAPGHDRA